MSQKIVNSLSAPSAIVLLWLALGSWNFRRVWARQPASVTPAFVADQLASPSEWPDSTPIPSPRVSRGRGA